MFVSAGLLIIIICAITPVFLLIHLSQVPQKLYFGDNGSRLLTGTSFADKDDSSKKVAIVGSKLFKFFESSSVYFVEVVGIDRNPRIKSMQTIRNLTSADIEIAELRSFDVIIYLEGLTGASTNSISSVELHRENIDGKTRCFGFSTIIIHSIFLPYP